MIFTLDQVNPDTGHDCNPIWVTVGTQNIVPKLYNFSLWLTGLTEGETLQIIINGKIYSWGVKDNPTQDELCDYLPSYPGFNIANWHFDVLNAIKLNWELYCLFDFDYNGDGIRFTLKECGNLIPIVNYSGTEPFTVIDEDTGTISDMYLRENLSSYLSVLKRDSNGGTEKLIDLNANYDKKTRQACFNIQKAFDLEPFLPNQINGGQFVLTPQPAHTIWCDYSIAHGEKFGSPPTAKCVMVDESIYTIIHGSKACDNKSELFDPDCRIWLLHNHKSCENPNFKFEKKVSKEQPDWMYFFVNTPTRLSIDTFITFEDGTTAIRNLRPQSTNPLDRGAYFIGTGHDQLNFSTLPQSVLKYEIFITDEDGKEYRICYDVCCECHPYACYILYFNGCGGCETVYLSGRKKVMYEVKKEIACKLKTKDSKVSDHQYFSINGRGKRAFKVNSGFHTENYIGQLRNLLLGKAWLINKSENQFLPIEVETKSMVISEDDKMFENMGQRESSFDLDFYLAFDDCYFNC